MALPSAFSIPSLALPMRIEVSWPFLRTSSRERCQTAAKVFWAISAPIMRHEEMRKRAAPAALPRRHWLRGLSVYEPSGFTTPGSLAVQPASRRL